MLNKGHTDLTGSGILKQEKRMKYAASEDYIFQWSETDKTWACVAFSDFAAEADESAKVGYKIADVDFNEDSFEIIEYPADMLDAHSRKDDYNTRDLGSEIWSEVLDGNGYMKTKATQITPSDLKHSGGEVVVTVDMKDFDCNEIYSGFEKAVGEYAKLQGWDVIHIDFDTVNGVEPFATVTINW